MLKPGGRFAVSDVVVRGDVPRAGAAQHGTVGRLHRRGASTKWTTSAKLAKAGFDSIDIEPTRVYSVEDARQFLAGEGIDVDAISEQVEGKFMSAFIRAEKPSSTATSRKPAAVRPAVADASRPDAASE